ncbi:unnamed protein product [Musa banksii]
MSFLEMISWQSVHKQACSLQKNTQRKNDRSLLQASVFFFGSSIKIVI